jgi:hypothetical protein
VRGLPPLTAPSQAAEEVCTLPEQAAEEQFRLADELDVDDGPEVGWPLAGLPVFGSIRT